MPAKEIWVILVEVGPVILSPFHPKLQSCVRKLGVEVRADTMATDMDTAASR